MQTQMTSARADASLLVKPLTWLKTGDLVLVGGKARQVLNSYQSGGVDLAFLGGSCLPGGKKIDVGGVFVERLSLDHLTAAGAVELCLDLSQGG